MSESDKQRAAQLYQRATEQFDLFRFGQAAELYRTAMALDAPGPAALTNMRVAHNQTMVDACHQASLRYPDHYEVRYAETCALADAGLHQRAAALCTELLGRFGAEPKHEVNLRLQRLSCSVKTAGAFTTLTEDVTELLATAGARSERLRKVVIRHLVETSSDHAIEPLNALLANRDVCSGDLRALVETKIAALKLLQRC